jgi:formamidopyrimidine-DNA glycosylase
MPELPEVETTRRGIARGLVGKRVRAVVVRERRQRWPIPRGLGAALRGQRIDAVRRRGKYLLIDTPGGSALVHLGMTGSLLLVDSASAPRKHDHWDLVLDDGRALRMHDPRRFGALLWIAAGRDPARHALLAALGPEPLDLGVDALAAHLAATARGRRGAVKQFLMDGKVVVGVGNIYASEALFAARVRPGRAAGRVTAVEWRAIARAVQRVLARAIAKGGTTLRDFAQPDGTPGYFRIRLSVYDRAGEPCRRCGALVRSRVQSQRATYWCPECQR